MSGGAASVLRAICVEPGDRRVEQSLANRAGRGRVAQLFLEAEDQLIEGLEAQVPLLDGRLFGRLRLSNGAAKLGVVVQRPAEQAARRPGALKVRAAASAGRRRARFQTRSQNGGWWARIGSPARNRRRSSARSSAVAYRRPGDFSRHFMQIVSMSRGKPG